ncbi:MAG: hypothetical protein CME62_12920 [Halobacteriovoraceae bacterium]|nr:hypothetical protein [Halobacteriovoraceae bacterium]|tara:strand:+ start:29988 stop:31205 length:1218 start_codon:yes stop_codon:yes gene_type:complete
MKKHLIFIQQLDQRFWGSCDEIEQAYEDVFPHLSLHFEVLKFEFNFTKLDHAINQLKDQLAHMKGEIIIYFLSHNIDFNNFLKELVQYKEKVKICIPIYGDMTVEIERWHKAEEILKGWYCHFIVASHASKKQILTFANIDQDSISILRHPLNKPYFKSNTLIKPLKESYIYAGRISYGKNVFQLIDTFHKAIQINPQITLDIYGHVDEIGNKFHGISPTIDDMTEAFNKLIKNSHENIKYHGHVTSEEILMKYKEHEYFVSMSTYHDEDYGLAVAQALACGCTPVLSNWGGFKDYEPAHLIATEIDKNGIFTFNESKLLEALLRPKKNDQNHNREYALAYTPEQISKNLGTILNQCFNKYQGQSEIFKHYYLSYHRFKNRPFMDILIDDKILKLYLEIYKGYYE